LRAKILLNIITLLISFSGIAQVPTIERDALIAIYNSTDGANWTDNTNWNTTAPVSSWFGVTVTGNSVTGITLTANNLNGTIPVEIGNLTNLITLRIQNEALLTGTIPTTVGNLINLDYLSIDYSGVSGNIPSEIGNLTNLTFLSLFENILTGSIPPELGNLVNLTTLTLSNNPITGNIPPELGNLINLVSFALSYNDLTGDIPPSIGNLVNIENLNIAGNNLTGPLPSGFGDMSNAQTIFMSYNQLTGTIPEGFGNMISLRALSISSNQFTGTVPESFNNLTNLTILGLNQNNLEGVLPDFTSNLSLNYLDFENNNFQFGDFENQHAIYSTYPNYSNNPQNQINIEETRYANIGNSINLTTTASGSANTYQWYKGIYPGGALLPGETNDTLNFPAIQAADAGDYYCIINSTIVTDLTLVRRPIHLNVENGGCEVTDRDALTRLYNLTDGPNWTNNTNWNTAAPLNTWFGVITNASGCVIRVDLNPTDNALGTNNLVGVIPPEIGNMTSLQLLDLSFNDLSGNIPDEIDNLIDLQGLNLSFNSLDGIIPTSIGNLQNLEYLNFATNNLTGTIPVSLTTINNVTFLSLSGNQLSGTIPIAITSMNNLETLGLSNNEFTGFIYPEYGNLNNLIYLNLGANQLTGSIPTELGNLSNLTYLQLGNQNLEGPIPNSFGNLTNLSLLSIQNTNISGTVPAEFGNLSALTILFLNSNNLSGNLPTELSNLTMLTAVGLEGNAFEGNLPNLGGNLNLIFLRIEDNQFQFGDFENQHPTYLSYSLYNFSPQAKVNAIETQDACNNENITLNTTVSGTQNTYQWYKGIYPSGTLLAGETNADLIFNNVQLTDSSEYYCLIDSDIVTDLTLVRNQITLNVVSSSIVANPIDAIELCDDNNDGFEAFPINISDIESQVLGIQTGFTVSYFDDLGNPLILTNPFTNTSINSQTITVRVSNGADCYEETTLDLIVNPKPIVDQLTDVTECEDYTLPTLTTGNFYTQPNAGGALLNSGDLITQTQTIYIYELTNGCSDESNFAVTINPLPPVDSLSAITSCENYILEPLTNGNYYTETNASGSMLNAGDSITTSQTLFIYNNINGCVSESSFSINITTPNTIVILPEISECDMYILPTLTSGNYYTQADGLGMLLSAGDTITNSQTIYIYDTTTLCPTQNRFEVNIIESALVDEFMDVEVCGNYILPIVNNGNYYTNTNGTGTLLNAGDSIDSSQTIYVYNNTNNSTVNCPAESSFTVDIFPIVDFELSLSNIEATQTDIVITMADLSINYMYAIDNGSFQIDNSFYGLADGTHTLIVSDSNGCIEKLITFEVYLDKFIIPNFFTPNGDNENEVWQITDREQTITSVTIFNRYGKSLKQLSPISLNWNGVYKGNLMPSSDYWYLIEGVADGKPYQITGHFALKR
jgi:gliding motility-associated-like protein